MSVTDEQMRRMLYGRAAEERAMASQGMPGRWEPVPDPASPGPAPPTQQVMAQDPWPETVDGVAPMVVQMPNYTPTPAQQVLVGAGVNAGIAEPAPDERPLTPDQIAGQDLDSRYKVADGELQRLLGLQREFLPRPGTRDTAVLGPASESQGVMRALESQIDAARQRLAAVNAERSAFIQAQRSRAQDLRDRVRLQQLGLIPADGQVAPPVAEGATPTEPAAGATGLPAYLTPNAPAASATPAATAGASAAPARTPDASTTTTAEPATVTPVPRPAAAAPAQGSVPASSIGAPPDGVVTVRDRQGLPVPMQCTSNVCSPDIQAGNFYANATQSGFASSGYSELDRYFDAAVRQELAGGPQGVLATEAADRAMGVQDLRMSPVYQQLYAQNLQVTGNDAQAAQALTDVSFRQAAATRAPGLSLGLAEQDITPAIDNLMSQRAGMALAMGDPRHMNPLSDAAESVGYYGGGGGLLYGTPDGSPAVLTQQGNQTLRDTPVSYAAPSMARRLGVEGMLARADATEKSAQRLLTAAAGSGSASNALTALRINNPEAYQQMLYHEALSRARGQAEGRGTPVSAWEQLLNLRADQ